MMRTVREACNTTAPLTEFQVLNLPGRGVLHREKKRAYCGATRLLSTRLLNQAATVDAEWQAVWAELLDN
jgi:hypothetical protein